MILHRGNAGDGPFVEATEDELRERGLTDDQIGELRGKRAARRNGPVVSLAGDKRLADVLREVDDRPTAADWAGQMALAEDAGRDDAAELRRGEAERFAANMAMPGQARLSLSSTVRLVEVPTEVDEQQAQGERIQALQLASQIGGAHARALRTLHFAWFAVAFALFSLGFTLGGVCHRMFGASTP